MPSRRTDTATTTTIARVNQTAIVELLRESGPLSRQQIGVRTGLSPATVNRLTATLAEQGIIVADGQEPSTGGRPSVLLRYSGGTRLVAALELHSDRVLGILMDFDGKIVYRSQREFDHGMGEDRQALQLGVITKTLDDLTGEAGQRGTAVVAVGVAVPGVVRFPEGAVGRTLGFGWEDLPLGLLLRQHSRLPVIVENDANAIAFGELQRGAGRGLSSFVALYLDRGFGAGIITNGALHRGFQAEAGEVGYLLMDRLALTRRFQESGDLEERIGSTALTRRAKEAGLPNPTEGAVSAEYLLALASEGSPAAREISDEILDMLAISIASLVVVLDPELVIVGGSILSWGEEVISAINERLNGRIIRVPRLLPTTFGMDAVLIGAAELAVAEVNDFTYLAR